MIEVKLRSVAAVVFAVVLMATGVGAAAPGFGTYQDVDRATASGYLNTHECVPGMGIHFVNPALVDDEVSVSEPEVLVYAWNDQGELELVAIEYVSTEAFELLGSHSHYNPALDANAMHAWFFLPNQDGLTADFNPRIDSNCHIN